MTHDAAAPVSRKSTRLSFLLQTELHIESMGRQLCRVRDLSAGGMKVQLESVPSVSCAEGALVTATLRGTGKIKGQVAWAKGSWLGVRFEREINPELARKPVGQIAGTPDFVKPVLVPSRRLKYVEGL